MKKTENEQKSIEKIPKQEYLDLFNKLIDNNHNANIILNDKDKSSFFIRLKKIIDTFIKKSDNLNEEIVQKDVFQFFLRKLEYIGNGQNKCKFYLSNNILKKDDCFNCLNFENKQCSYILYAFSCRADVDELLLKYFGLYGYKQIQESINIDELYQCYIDENSNKKINVKFLCKPEK